MEIDGLQIVGSVSWGLLGFRQRGRMAGALHLSKEKWTAGWTVGEVDDGKGDEGGTHQGVAVLGTRWKRNV